MASWAAYLLGLFTPTILFAGFLLLVWLRGKWLRELEPRLVHYRHWDRRMARHLNSTLHPWQAAVLLEYLEHPEPERHPVHSRVMAHWWRHRPPHVLAALRLRAAYMPHTPSNLHTRRGAVN